jgi:hypothetical protein
VNRPPRPGGGGFPSPVVPDSIAWTLSPKNANVVREMPEYYLVVSNPPHRDGEEDVQPVAECLEIAAAEARRRIKFPAPEIWLVETDHDAAKHKAEALYAAGLNCAVIAGRVLAAVPPLQHVEAFSMSDAGFVATLESEEIQLHHDRRVVVVVSDPAPLDARMTRETQPGEHHGEMVMDLYVLTDPGWRALSLDPAHVDFSGLGAMKMPTSIANVHSILEAFRANYSNARIDERMVGVDYHYVVVRGVVLPKVLVEISERFDRLDPYTLGTCLAFLTAK